MKKSLVFLSVIFLLVATIFCYERASGDKSEIIELSIASSNNVKNEENVIDTGIKKSITFTPYEVPNVNSSFKAWMDYRMVTNKQSPQYKFIHTNGWRDTNGFMRCGADWDYGIKDDYYLIALGSYYGTTIGTKYRITTDNGNVFYGVLADCKADVHTDHANQHNPWNGNIVEFIVDSRILNKDVKRMGSANVYMPLNGSISKIERMDFITE